MNPDTNTFEPLMQYENELLRPDGTPVPKHWTQFTVGEIVMIKEYTFRVEHIGEKHILFEPVGPVLIQPGKNAPCPCGSGKWYKRCCLGKKDKP